MLILPPETVRLAQRLAAAQGVSPQTAVQRALEESAKAAGVAEEPPPRRRDYAAMMADAAAIAGLPLLDPTSPEAILDELNET